MVFTLLYFEAFLREAAQSERFPADATLFGAFSRTHLTNLIMLLALFVPPLSSLAIAIASKIWVLYVEFVLVAFATGWVFVGFQRGSYFNRSPAFIRTKLDLRWKRKPKPEKVASYHSM